MVECDAVLEPTTWHRSCVNNGYDFHPSRRGALSAGGRTRISRPVPRFQKTPTAGGILVTEGAAVGSHSQKAPPRAKSERGPPMTLGSVAKAGLRLIVWCRGCHHQVEPDPAQLAERYGAETHVLDWHTRLVCSKCGGRDVDFVVSGTKRR